MKTNMNIEATLEAIKILREMKSWNECESVGQTIRVRAWIKLEHEARKYLTGVK